MTISYFFGLMRNMTMSVALGYHSVYLCVVPQLLTALVLWICKCFADKEFRSWSVGDQVIYALVGSVLPCVTPKTDTEITSEDVEGQDVAETGNTDIEAADIEDPLPESKEPREATSNMEQAEELQEEDQTDEELKENTSGKKSNSKELCWIFILHTVNVILGVAAFAFLHETSTELVTAEMKVKNESKIDPPTTMPIIISSLLS